jgi:hypothetical protein
MVFVGSVLLDPVHTDPNARGLPGGGFLQRLIDWGAQVALWGSLGAVLAGAAMAGLGNHSGNYQWSSRGKSVALGGCVGAALVGLAPQLVNLFHEAARS